MQMSRAAGHGVPSWDRYYNYDLGWKAHIQNVASHVPLLLAVRSVKPRRILEVGSGTGSLSILLSYLHDDVTSVDLSEPVLERARRNNRRLRGRANFQQGDAFDLADVPDGAFDVAVSQGFFEHFNDDQIERLLREQLRVARRVVFSVPNAAYARQDRGDERLLTARQWESMLAARDFQIERSAEYRGVSRHLLTPGGWRRPATMYLATLKRPQ